MYERIDRLRDELERAKKRKAEADQRVKNCEERLKAAENNQIIAEVNALKLKPEELARLLQLATAQKGAADEFDDVLANAYPKSDLGKEKSDYIYEDEESEETEDEEN